MTSLLAIPTLRAALLLVLGVAAIALVACGGGDEDSGEPTAVAETPTGTVTPTETAPPTETATPPPTETPASTPSPEPDGDAAVDARYLRDLCIAGNDFQAAVFMAVMSGDMGDGPGDEEDAEDAEPSLEEFMEQISEPLATLLERLQALTPPDDVAEFHAAALKGYEEFMGTLAALDEGVEDPDAAPVDPLDLLGNLMMAGLAVPPLPEATLARLAEVAESIPECEDSIFLNAFLQDSGSSMDPGATGDSDPGATDAVPAEDVREDVTPEDEAYVRELCLTGKTFESALLENFAGLDIDPVAATREAQEDPQLFARIYLEPMRALIAEMRLMTPPESAAAAHAANIDYLGESASEDTARFEARTEAEAPMFSSEDADRLAAAANNVPECYGSGFLLGILGGGLSGGVDGGVVGSSDIEEGEVTADEGSGGGASGGSANATPGSTPDSEGR